MLTSEQIDAYEKEVEQKYQRETEAIRIMRRLLDISEGRLIDKSQQPYLATTPSSFQVLPPLEGDSETPTLASKIEQIVSQYAQEKWTMRRMLAYLKQINYPLSEKPEGTISAALGKLATQRKLNVVRRGYGSVASIYQWNPDWKESPINGEPDAEDSELLGGDQDKN